MPKYKLIAGRLQTGGKTYSKGDVVELSEDVFRKHGRGKLEKVEEGFAAPQQAAAKPARTATKDTAAASQESVESSFGDDVTDEFEGAADAGLKVFGHNGWYHVVAADDPETPLNEKGMRRDVAESFVKEQS
jgi:hypothetical protein